MYSVNPKSRYLNNPDIFNPARAAIRDRSPGPTRDVPAGEFGPLAIQQVRRAAERLVEHNAKLKKQGRSKRDPSPEGAGRAFEPAPRPKPLQHAQQRRASEPGPSDSASLASRPSSSSGSEGSARVSRPSATPSRRASLAPSSAAVATSAGPQPGPSTATEEAAARPSRRRRFAKLITSCLPFRKS